MTQRTQKLIEDLEVLEAVQATEHNKYAVVLAKNRLEELEAALAQARQGISLNETRRLLFWLESVENADNPKLRELVSYLQETQ